MKREVDAETAAQLLGTMTENPVGAVRGLVETAISIVAPAQRTLGKIADGEEPSDPETLRAAKQSLEIARQCLSTAIKTLDIVMEGKKPTAPGGAA